MHHPQDEKLHSEPLSGASVEKDDGAAILGMVAAYPTVHPRRTRYIFLNVYLNIYLNEGEALG